MDAVIYRPGDELPGTPYRVLKHLATGGMGSVYEVEDTTVEKRYVLKTLHPQLLAREDLAKKMKEEAKMLAKLHHPNIVDVVTAGITQDGMRVPYYVMERLNGVNLRHMLEKKGALDLVHALRVAIDVLDALEHAHEHGVVHRDVKPENIYLHRNASGTTTTKLLDFGIMRLIDRKSTDVTRGKFVGTIRYASPEQIMGEDVGPASDLYAVGLLLYEMIAGKGPFDDITEAYAIGMAHVSRAPPPLSQVARDVPVEVQQIVHAALGKKPHERPPDAYTFSTELRRLVPGGPLSPRAPQAVTPATPVAPVTPGVSDPMAYGATEVSRPNSPPVYSTPIDPMALNATSMAAEAQMRPPANTSFVVPIAIAAVIGAAVIAGAVLYVVRGRPVAAAVPPPPSASVVAAPSAIPANSGSAESIPAASAAPSAVASSAPIESTKPRPPAVKAVVPRPAVSAKKPLRPEDVGYE